MLFIHPVDTIFSLDIQTAYKLTDVGFVDIAGSNGRLTATAITEESPPSSPSDYIYFWDDYDSPTGDWTLCLAGADELSDCNRDDDGDPKPGGSNDEDSIILRAWLRVDFDPAVMGGVVNFDTNYTVAPTIDPPVAATGTDHALITGTFAPANIIVNSLPKSVAYEIDYFYLDGQSDFNNFEDGTLTVADFGFVPGPLALGLRYYPELPNWAFDNGWHDSIMMAYATDYRPDTPTNPCSEGTDCIQINNISGNNDDKISILVIAGQHDWNDDGLAGLADDIDDVFDAENDDLDDLFDVRAANGNDTILVIDEL